MTEGEWRYFTDTPFGKDEIWPGHPDWWTDHQLTADYKLGGSEKGNYTIRRWRACEDAVLDAWTQGYPGTRPSTWWRFAASGTVRTGEATWEVLDRFGLWLEGERERAEALAGRLKKGREVVETPEHPDWDRRGASKPRT
jgi:hypothetical protein